MGSQTFRTAHQASGDRWASAWARDGEGFGRGPDCGYYEKRRRLALWPAGDFLWGGQSRILLFIARNIKLPTLPRGTVRPSWILTTSTATSDGRSIPPLLRVSEQFNLAKLTQSLEKCLATIQLFSSALKCLLYYDRA